MSEETPLEDRTEEPSEKKREQFREEGRVAKSTELAAGVVLFASGLALAITFRLSDGFVRSARAHWASLDDAYILIERPGALFSVVGWEALRLLGPFMLLLVIAAVTAHMMQIGPLLAFKALAPKPQKLNPINGIKKLLFSKDTWFNILKTSAKVLFVGAVATATIWLEGQGFLILSQQPAEGFSAYLQKISVWTVFSCSFAILLVGSVDLAWQKHRHHRQMMMTREEAKREHKEMEGDPYQKGRRQRQHREILSMNRLLDAVPDADVIINNPTHVSVALRYKPEDGSPVVVAKGTDAIAHKIREVAKDHQIPMVTNVELARALHRHCDVGQGIPEEFFEAVARVLVFVWKQYGRRGIR